MNAPSEVIIGVDVGTTAVKVAAFRVDGAPGVLCSALREYPLEQPEPGWQVQDPVTVLAGIDSAVADCLAQLVGARVLAISLSTAMHGLIGLDAEHRPLTPLVTWADGRARTEARRLRQEGLARGLLRRSGTPVHPMSPLVKLIWFTRHEPELAAQVRWWVGLKDYVLLHLTGELVTELSSASGTGLLSVERREWDADSLQLAGVGTDQLPRVLPTTAVLQLTREAGRRLGAPSGLPVAVGAADGPLGNLGTGAITPGVAGLSLGTSGAVRMMVSEPRFDAGGRLFCYALTDDLWSVGGAVSNGGNTLRWAGGTFATDLVAEGHADVDVLELAGQAPAGSDGLLMLPYVLSERAPLWDPDLAGAYLGIRSHHTRSHFVRAAIEGVCLQLSAIVDSLDSVAPVHSIRATGGPFRSELWRQIMAATLARPMSVESAAGGTALGAAALGWFALDGAPSLSEALAAVGGPHQDSSVPTVTVSSFDVSTYAQLRARVGPLIDSYQDVAGMFASSSSSSSPARVVAPETKEGTTSP
jgi:gluconokinase